MLRRSRSLSGCRPPRRGPRRSRSGSATSRASTGWPSGSRSPATSASNGPRSAVSSPSAAASSTSSRRPAASRSASSCSATRSRPIRAFSPFTQRALQAVEEALVYPAAERRLDLVEPTLAGRRRAARARRTTSSRPCPRRRTSSGGPTTVREAWQEELGHELELGAASRLDPLPAGAAVRLRGAAARDRRARPRRGRERAAELRPRRHPRRRRVPAPRRGAAHAGPAPPRRGGHAASRGTRCRARPRLRFAVSPARRGFVWRELGLALLPDTQVFRKRAPRADARLGRALQSFADLRTGDYVVHEDHGVGRLLGFETKTVAGVTRDYLFARLPRRRPAVRPARADRQGLALHRRRRPRARALQARRQGLAADQDPRARVGPRAGGRADHALRAAPDDAGRRLRPDERVARAPRGELPLPRDRGPATAIEAVKEDLEAARPMDRLVCGDVGFGKTEVAVRAAFAVALDEPPGADARPHDRAGAAALEHVPRALRATSRCASRWSPASASPPT